MEIEVESKQNRVKQIKLTNYRFTCCLLLTYCLPELMGQGNIFIPFSRCNLNHCTDSQNLKLSLTVSVQAEINRGFNERVNEEETDCHCWNMRPDEAYRGNGAENDRRDGRGHVVDHRQKCGVGF